ncbi:MAG: phosphoenolpyruvate hydrolase family protein [Oscillospiraceae bacterium]|nr:phosphoenolpyruvate hydrolase family protein [Oscillospiraceae bacterium]
MAKQYTASEVLARLKAERAAGRYLYTVGVGTGITAKFVERGGADLISTYPLAKFRMAGLSSMAGYLPICDSNALTLELGEREILPIVQDVPVCAGLLGADPTRDMERLLDRVKSLGFSGIYNSPSMSAIDGSLRAAFEETGLPFQKEIDMMELAVKHDLFTHAACTTADEARRMADVGVPLIVACMGNSVGGSIGNKTAISLDETCKRVNHICDAVKRAHPEAMIISHGGPISGHTELQYVVDNCPQCDGYMGGSSAERFPVEVGVRETTERFKAVR